MRETCSLCGLTQARGRMWPSWTGGRWLCADVAGCCGRFLAAWDPAAPPALIRISIRRGRHRKPPARQVELGA